MYVLITWLLINLLHPVALTVSFNFEGGLFNTKDLLELYFPIFLYSLLFSTPSLLISYGIIYLIKRFHQIEQIQFLLWLLAACVTVIANYLILFKGFGGGIRLEDLQIAVPGVIATAFVILIRYNWFLRAIKIENNNDI